MKCPACLIPIVRRLEGKVALITGGATGIGRSSAKLFLQHGAKVVIADDQDGEKKFRCDCHGSNEAVSFVTCDVTSDSDVKKAVDEATSKHGKLDIMFSNAGINGNVNPSIFVANDEDFKRVLNVNVLSAFLAAKHAANVMHPQKKGSIIFTSSVSSVTAGDVPHAYAASKHALVGLTKNLCVDLGAYGIRVNCISPFPVPNLPPWQETLEMEEEKMKKVVSESVNLKEMVTDDEDAAKAALYLASDDSKYVSGLNLVVDGGYSTTNATFRENLKKYSIIHNKYCNCSP